MSAALAGRDRGAEPPRPVLYGDRARWGLIHGDAMAALDLLPEDCVDAVVTDPPYGLGFAGAAWDGGALAGAAGFENFTRQWAGAALRLLKPGGYLVCFGAPRTFHRLVVGIEDAGLEVRDQLLWLYGSGVPKSRTLPGGLGSALKPAYEPILLARAPLETGTLVANAVLHGTGALNIEAARIVGARHANSNPCDQVGRWPANVLLGHEPECGERCSPNCVAGELDRVNPRARPSRFFYAAKASRAEREAGLEHVPQRAAPVFSGRTQRPRANVHPTVKPIALMRWLVRLAVPLGGVVLDPFTGSGSTGIAALLEGRQFLGMEREPEYVQIARARLAHWTTAVQ